MADLASDLSSSAGSDLTRRGPIPSEILQGIVLTLDAADVVVASGKVATFNNAGGTPITQATAAQRAAYSAADAQFRGQPVATFVTDGPTASIWNVYDLPDLSALTQGEVFAVLASQYGAAPGPGGSERYTGLWHMGADLGNVHYPYPDGNAYDSFGSTVRKTYLQVSPAHAFTEAHVYNVSSAPGAYTARYNASVMHATASNTVGFASAPTFGAYFSASGLYGFNGRLAYLVVCSAVQSPAARAKMLGYLSTRFGTPTP